MEKNKEYQKAIEQRWQKVRKITTTMPEVRNKELQTILNLINANQGEKILEIGSGGGYLTFPLARNVGKQGQIITADVFAAGLEEVLNKNHEALPIQTHEFSPEYNITKKFSFNEEFDKIVSLATFHHFDNRDLKTEDKGRKNLLKECYSMLKKGGKIIIADVCHNTLSQQYFDKIDNPIHFYPTAHPHNFFEIEEFKKIFEEIGFQNVNTNISSVPWQFESSNMAAYYLHQLHNAKCSPKESLQIGKEILGFEKKAEKKYELGWELGFIIGEK